MAVVQRTNDYASAGREVVPTLRGLEMRYGRDGHVTLAVHGTQAWEGASQRSEYGRIGTLVAHDADGSFAKALGADDVPDVFVIDRAGQMRFADIDQRQLPAAVRGLIRETREEALAAGERRAQAQAKRGAAKGRNTTRAQPGGSDEAEKLPPRPGAAASACGVVTRGLGPA